MFHTRSISTLILILGVHAAASAQDSTSAGAAGKASPFSFTASVMQSRPQGDLARNIGIGYGGEITFLYNLDAAGILSLRANAGVAQYGDEVNSTSFSGGAAGRVDLAVHTSNYIVPMSVGPQLMWPTGLLRPYVNAGVGGQAYFTESRVEGPHLGSVIASTTNQSDFSLAWTAGGGLYVPFSVRSRHVAVDLGAEYMNGGSTRYLAQGSITDLPSGISVSPLESSTHLVIVKLGARVGL